MSKDSVESYLDATRESLESPNMVLDLKIPESSRYMKEVNLLICTAVDFSRFWTKCCISTCPIRLLPKMPCKLYTQAGSISQRMLAVRPNALITWSHLVSPIPTLVEHINFHFLTFIVTGNSPNFAAIFIPVFIVVLTVIALAIAGTVWFRRQSNVTTTVLSICDH